MNGVNGNMSIRSWSLQWGKYFVRAATAWKTFNSATLRMSTRTVQRVHNFSSRHSNHGVHRIGLSRHQGNWAWIHTHHNRGLAG